MTPTCKLILADHVAAENGKLYINGAGWNICTGEGIPPSGIGVIVTVPYDQTNRPLRIDFVLVDGDGQPVQDPEGNQVGAGGIIEMGRPPGLKAGQDQNSVLAINVAPMPLPPGFYRWEARHDDQVLDWVGFQVREPQP